MVQRFALYVDFIARLFPQARFVVLVRNPLATLSSLRMAMGTGIRPRIPIYDSPQPVFRVLTAFGRAVAAAFAASRCYRIWCARRRSWRTRQPRSPRSAVPPGALSAGDDRVRRAQPEMGRPGDPVLVNERTRPTDEPLLDGWKLGMGADPAQAEFAPNALASMSDDDLAAWGYARPQLEREITDAEA
jgi:Sulfotransferase family